MCGCILQSIAGMELYGLYHIHFLPCRLKRCTSCNTVKQKPYSLHPLLSLLLPPPLLSATQSFLISNFCHVLNVVFSLLVIPQRPNFICRHFRTFCLFHFICRHFRTFCLFHLICRHFRTFCLFHFICRHFRTLCLFHFHRRCKHEE